MTKDELWSRLLLLMQEYDGGRDATDEAHEWADTEARIVARPEDTGGWKASMEMAFDAGRAYERMARRERPPWR